MMPFSRKYSVLAFLVLATALQSTPAFTEEQGTITGLRISQDLSQVMVQYTGKIGNYKSFAMKNPFRLVVDVDSTNLAGIPGKIKIDRQPINEIRIAQANSRTRLVVDFGDNPVPGFTIEQLPKEMRINLGKTLRHSAAHNAVKPEPKQPPRPSSPTRVSSGGEASMAIKKARLNDNRVLVELCEPGDPTKTYRLVVDVNPRKLDVTAATLTDHKGNTKRFGLSAAQDGPSGVMVETVKPAGATESRTERTGPRKGMETRFRWGVQQAPDEIRTKSGPKRIGGLRMEGFELQPREAAADAHTTGD